MFYVSLACIYASSNEHVLYALINASRYPPLPVRAMPGLGGDLTIFDRRDVFR